MKSKLRRPTREADGLEIGPDLVLFTEGDDAPDDAKGDRSSGLDHAEIRKAGLTAVVLLFFLNITDIVLTEMILRRGGVELNPVVDELLASHSAVVLKLLIVGLLALDFVFRRPRLITLCLLWLVVGIYVMVVILNGTQLMLS